MFSRNVQSKSRSRARFSAALEQLAICCCFSNPHVSRMYRCHPINAVLVIAAYTSCNPPSEKLPSPFEKSEGSYSNLARCVIAASAFRFSPAEKQNRVGPRITLERVARNVGSFDVRHAGSTRHAFACNCSTRAASARHVCNRVSSNGWFWFSTASRTVSVSSSASSSDCKRKVSAVYGQTVVGFGKHNTYLC